MDRASLLRRGRGGLVGALALLLVACASPTAPAGQTSSPAAPAVTATAVTSASPDATDTATTEQAAQPAPLAVCTELRDALVQQLSLDVTLREVPVQDTLTGVSSPGCQLSANGSAAELGAFLDVAGKLRTLLTEAGWSEDQRYLADGPTGTATAYSKNNVLTRTLVEWQPSPQASCPADQPISACQLTPEQQLLRITLDLTQQ